ncbi:MAG: heavy metal translocating P-type ATPase, partial [Alphaproteobacteria bacterium]|nr:heavy metal translocating P-type ATPase [Alphaproteobacteria bacterium]
LAALEARAVTVLDADGKARVLRPEAVARGMVALVASGARIGVDGTVVEGRSSVDAALVTGESLPVAVGPGDRVHAGTLNLGAALRVRIEAVGADTLLAEIARLTEAAGQGRSQLVALADRVARVYAPAVHGLALATLIGWLAFSPVPWTVALTHAVAVLIVTCPCALALAVPVVQVVAVGRLMRRGILVKSATALERLAEIDTVVFDKTGTLTGGRPELIAGGEDGAALATAAALASASTHPLARALVAAAPAVEAAANPIEHPGRGLEAGAIRLGNRAFCGLADDQADTGPELWLVRPGRAAHRFAFADRPRGDAAATVDALQGAGYRVVLLSGDRAPTVAAMAAELGIAEWRAGLDPKAKLAALEGLRSQGWRTLMVGDGLNDAPALAAAHASLSPAAAADISRVAADAVFQGECLAPAVELLTVARRTQRLVRQNLTLAIAYNVLAVPLAMAGQLTPLLAAVAMSSSSLLVIGNALRLGQARWRWMSS